MHMHMHMQMQAEYNAASYLIIVEQDHYERVGHQRMKSEGITAGRRREGQPQDGVEWSGGREVGGGREARGSREATKGIPSQ
jgi:hypothetical protein